MWVTEFTVHCPVQQWRGGHIELQCSTSESEQGINRLDVAKRFLLLFFVARPLFACISLFIDLESSLIRHCLSLHDDKTTGFRVLDDQATCNNATWNNDKVKLLLRSLRLILWWTTSLSNHNRTKDTARDAPDQLRTNLNPPSTPLLTDIESVTTHESDSWPGLSIIMSNPRHARSPDPS